MAGQPGTQFAIGFDFFLQRLQRLQPRGQIRLLCRLCVDPLLQRTPRVVLLRHGSSQFFQTRLSFNLRFLCRHQLRLQAEQPGFVGCVQSVAIGGEALKPVVQGACLFFNIALVSSQHLNLLLYLRGLHPLRIGLALRGTPAIFQRGQLVRLLFGLGSQQFGFFFGLHCQAFQCFGFNGGIFLALGPLRCLGCQLQQPLLNAQAAIHHKADFSFQPAHLGAGFV